MAKNNPYEYTPQDIIDAFNVEARSKGVWGVTVSPTHLERKKVKALLDYTSSIQMLWTIHQYEAENPFEFDFRGWLKWADFYKDSLPSEDSCASIVLRKWFPNSQKDLVYAYIVLRELEETWFPTPEQKEAAAKAVKILEDLKRRL